MSASILMTAMATQVLRMTFFCRVTVLSNGKEHFVIIGSDPSRFHVYRLAVLEGIAFAGVNGIPFSETYEKMADA